MPEIHDVAVTRTDTRTSDSLTLKIRIESGEKLYIAVRMVYLNRNYAMAFIRDITEDEVQRRENEKIPFLPWKYSGEPPHRHYSKR